jgi:hypothetical protein
MSLIFLKWTTGNRWSNIGNYSQSNLEQGAIFLSTKDTRRLYGTISHVQALVVSQGNYTVRYGDGTYLSETSESTKVKCISAT